MFSLEAVNALLNILILVPLMLIAIAALRWRRNAPAPAAVDAVDATWIVESEMRNAELAELRQQVATIAGQLGGEMPEAYGEHPRPRERMMAVFPTRAELEALDYSSERAALGGSGGPWDYIILDGARATRDAIALELRLGGARLIYFGAHARDGRIALSGEDYGTREWLARAVRLFSIKAVVINACGSDDFAQAVLAAGAEVVITTSDEIADRQAARLAVAFLQGLAAGDAAERAIEIALLAVDDATGSLIRLRGDAQWCWQPRRPARRRRLATA